MEMNEPVVTPQPEFHDYMAPEHHQTTDEKLAEASNHIDNLENLVEKLTVSRFGLHRFVNDPKCLLFYTGFSSYALVMNFDCAGYIYISVSGS